jgi:hypothetical protein
MTKRAPPVELHDNEVWVGMDNHRRICGLLADRVYYSRGGDSTLSCRMKTFLRWIKAQQATLVNKQ